MLDIARPVKGGTPSGTRDPSDGQTNTGPGDTPAYNEDDDFDVGQTLSAFPGGGADDSAMGTIVYASAGGPNVTVTFRNEEDANALGTTNDCFFTGTATIG